VCAPCLEKLQAIEASASCPRCAMPVPDEGAPCPHCFGAGVRPFGNILSLAPYREPLRHLIHAVKFHRAWSLAERLADRAYEKPAIARLLHDCHVIVPVPLHPWRQVRRGFNQAEVIARRLARRAGRPVVNAVVRLSHTEAQTELHSRARRVANLKRAFGLIDEKAVAFRRVVIVDDVRTTAATLQAIGRCVKQAAPSELDAIVLAAADPKHADFQTVSVK
jgi:ComF family protein